MSDLIYQKYDVLVEIFPFVISRKLKYNLASVEPIKSIKFITFVTKTK